MLFGGIVQSVRNVLRDNHNLTLSGKGRKINLGEATVRKSEIRTPDASPEVIDGIRTKSKRTRVFQRRVLVGVTLASIVFFLIVVLPIFKKETVKAEHVNEERIRKRKQWEEKLTFFTEDAWKWVAERHYDNAIIQYRNALTMQVTDRRIWQEFIYVLVLNCSINEQNCREAEFYTIAYQSFPAELQDEKFLHQIELLRGTTP